ncbi:MAG TPA: DnaJ domain-containing protein [Candidatus Lumbricidophila sp.]|nr:DnaJ domain-containing protein [Candidatus Lumbricidophila sp.]
MAESPLAASPYELLGVAATADDDTLRRAYRRALRAAHPDTGGSTAKFDAVQRAWELIGTPAARAAYDRGLSGNGRGAHAHGRAASGAHSDAPNWAPRPQTPRTDSRPMARSYGHPGGLAREHYLGRIREWVGRGVALPDPYDTALVRSAPADIRRILAEALAEEASARSLASLGIAFTIWHDVDAGARGFAGKLDHLVLGPTGLFAVESADFGGLVSLKRTELVGQPLAGAHPVHDLAAQAKAIQRAARVKPTALLVVVPDEQAAVPLEIGGSVRGAVVALVRRSRLASAIREGIPGSAHTGGTEVMEVRARLQQTVRFV